MSAKIKHIIIYILILGFGILIGWWLNELYRFADAMRNDIVRPFNPDTLVVNIDSIKQKEKLVILDSLNEKTNSKHQELSGDNSDKRLDLDLLQNDSQNQYLLTLKDNEIQICYGWQFDVHVQDYKLFTKRIEEYNDEYGNHKVDVYVYHDSFLKEYFNNHPEVNRLDLVCGKILTNEIKLTQGIQIGMDKSKILEKIFKPSDKFDTVSRLTIYEDERGESWVTLDFKDNKLVGVLFDSDYDWIDKGLKK